MKNDLSVANYLLQSKNNNDCRNCGFNSNICLMQLKKWMSDYQNLRCIIWKNCMFPARDF